MTSGRNEYQERVRAEKRSAIMTAAREVFERRGLHQTPIAEIAESANVSTATLYKHFASKERLFVEIVREHGVLFLLTCAAAEYALILEAFDGEVEIALALMQAEIAEVRAALTRESRS